MEEASDFLVVPVVYHSLVTTAHPSPHSFLPRLTPHGVSDGNGMSGGKRP